MKTYTKPHCEKISMPPAQCLLDTSYPDSTHEEKGDGWEAPKYEDRGTNVWEVW